MRTLVIGASQGTGALTVRAALARGHEVTAFARNPDKLKLDDPKLTKLRGDFHERSSVDEAVRGHDAVIITASTTLSSFKESPNFFSQGTALVIDAMRAHGVRRLVVLSALGVGESRALANFVVRALVLDFLIKGPCRDHERQERLTRDSGLDWVIARPGRLTNGPARGRYVKKAAIEHVPSSISRADVADFLVESTEGEAWVHKAVQLGG